MKLKYFCTGIFFLALVSCRSRNEALETALKLAGDNRPELEKVLSHYSKNPTDTLKLKAAKFLIENMPGHYTLEGNLINECRKKIDADTTGSYFAKKALDISLSQIDWIRKASHKKEDVEHIKADFLIRHIDLSFEHLHKYVWLEDIPFDLFLEYILPYRFENERLDMWRDSLHVSSNTMDELIRKNKIYTISQTEDQLQFEEPETPVSQSIIFNLLKQDIYKNCYHSTLKENFRSRAFNFPAAIDYILHYANRNGYHYENRIISPETKDSDSKRLSERKSAKIFRKTFSRHNSMSFEGNEYVPEFFNDPFHIDVTDQYLHTADILLDGVTPSANHVYLCVFSDLNWQPIAISNIADIKFYNMGKNLVYLPGYYGKKKLFSINYPFVLSLNGNIKYLVPDTNTREKVLIPRKYPYNKVLYGLNESVSKTIIEAANEPAFQSADTIHTLSSMTYYCQAEITSREKYRYWRISLPRNVALADLSFYDSKGKALYPRVDSRYIAGFDSDPLTNIRVPAKDTLVVDFNEPVEVSRIICLPQSDGNGIYPGNEYELYYHELEGWKSLGRKVSTDYYLEYNNVPRGALLWLHNHTSGIEERIFTFEKGRIRFW